jgi:dihydropyrimidinase
MPGVEHRLDLIFQGVDAGEISLARWVEVTSTTPARMFGLFPRKGLIAPGADADVVLYDPHATHTFSAATHHMNVDYSAYEGMKVKGKAKTVLSRGHVVIENDEYVGTPGAGVFLKRGLNGLLR